MKKSIKLSVLFAGIIISSGIIQASDMKIAVVDMELVMKAYPETKSSRLILEQQLSEFEKEQQGMLDDRDELEKKFKEAGLKAQNTALSSAVREKNRVIAEGYLDDLRTLESKIRETTNMRRQQLQERQLRMRRRIVKKLRTVIQGYCEKNGIKLVLDSAVPGGGNTPEAVVYNVDEMDITDQILELISTADADDGTKQKEDSK